MKQTENSPDLAKFLDRGAGTPNRQIEYVASPYWHPRREVRRARARAALAGTTLLIERGSAALSPVVYSATVQEQGNFSPPEGWYGFDLHLLGAAGGLTLLEIPGWENSRGILIELGFARGRGLPVRRVEWPEIRERLDPETVQVLEDPDGGAGRLTEDRAGRLAEEGNHLFTEDSEYRFSTAPADASNAVRLQVSRRVPGGKGAYRTATLVSAGALLTALEDAGLIPDWGGDDE